ncbi:MAG: proton-conducting transporter membrane subunit, partial [Candidatus Omnitrophica bacterium]|nr:proton-conducting transporter membrane subunit [Candidatus Omnitrophota bacterium]
MHLIPLFIILPLGGAFLVSLLGKHKKISDVTSCIITGSLAALSLRYFLALHGDTTISVYTLGGWLPPQGISLVMDNLSIFVLLIINCIAFLINIFSVPYMERFGAKTQFYTLFLLVIAGMNGVVLSGDIFNLFVFLEIASLANYALVAYRTDDGGLEASFKYIVMGSVASLFILLSITFLYSYTSTLNMADMAAVLAQKGLSKVVIFTSVLLLVGFSIKTALMPFHAWMPDAYTVAPVVIPALSTLMVKALGIYSIIRIFLNVLPVNHNLQGTLMFLGTLSLLLGGILAFTQGNFKRMLGYSSISQVGYIILALGIGSPLAITGALLHICNHCVFKPLLFLNAGALEYATDDENLDLNDMGGLRVKMPTTAHTSLVASMSLAGIPPFCGFFSKLIIIMACVQGGFLGYGVIAIIGSILTLSYIVKAQKS